MAPKAKNINLAGWEEGPLQDGAPSKGVVGWPRAQPASAAASGLVRRPAVPASSRAPGGLQSGVTRGSFTHITALSVPCCWRV